MTEIIGSSEKLASVRRPAVAMRSARRTMSIPVRNAGRNILPPQIWHGIDRPIDLSKTRKLDAVRTVPRCTSRCQPTRCMSALTTRAASVPRVVNAFLALGCYKATSERTQVRNRSNAASARRHLPTNRISGHTSKPIRIRSRIRARGAERPSPLNRTSTSTRIPRV